MIRQNNMKQLLLHPRMKVLFGDISTLWIMVTAGICVGFTLNQFRDTPLPLVYSSKAERIQQAAERIAKGSSEETKSGVDSATTQLDPSRFHPIDLDAFREMQSHVLVLDARPEIFHRIGHIPKALSLPREDFEASYIHHRAVLEKDKSQMILIYCAGGHCEDGKMVVDGLLKLGYTNVYLFKSGWHAWTQAKLPQEYTK